MIEEDLILSRGITLLEKTSDTNFLNCFNPQSRTCIVIRLNSYSLTEQEFVIDPVQATSNILSYFSNSNDGILYNQVSNITKSLLLIHLPTMYLQTIGSDGFDEETIYESSGFKIYNTDTIRLLPAYEFLKGMFANSPFSEDGNITEFQLKSSQRDIFSALSLNARMVNNTNNLEIFETYEKLTLSGSGIKTGQFIL